MEFTYTALNPIGVKVSELLQAEDEDQAIRRLQEQGMVVLSLVTRAPSKAKSSAMLARAGWSKIRQEHVVGMTRELAIMIETGVSLIDAFSLLAEHAENPEIRRALVSVLQEVSQGRSITQAMSRHPRLFPKLYIAMIASAEVGGTLHTTLQQAADYLESSLEMRRKVKSALTYPAVLMTAMVGVLIFIMVFLIPRFTDLFTHMNVAIPPTMRFMMAMSDFLRRHWWTIPGFIAAAGFGIRSLIRSPKASRKMMQLFLKTPILGDTTRKIAVARILRGLSTLLDSGVSLLVALDTITQLAQNVVYEDAIVRMRAAVEGGASLTEAVRGTDVFPAIVCQMTAVGEKSGRLTSVLLHIAQYYEREIDARLKALASIIEPVMIVVLGIVVGFIALSIFTPLYSIYDSIK